MALVPEYRLATLYRLRERNEEMALQALAQQLNALRQEQDKLAHLERELERMVAKREAKLREYTQKSMRGEMNARDVSGADVYLKRLKELEALQLSAIDQQKTVIKERQEEVEHARQAAAQATREKKALETHRDRWNQDHRSEAARKDEDTMDELAQAMSRAKT